MSGIDWCKIYTPEFSEYMKGEPFPKSLLSQEKKTMGVINLSITVPDAVEAAMVDAFARANGWTPANAMTRAQFCRDFVRAHFQQVSRLYKKESDKDTAATNADTTTSTWQAT